MFTIRSLVSLSQYLGLQTAAEIELLCLKYGIEVMDDYRNNRQVLNHVAILATLEACSQPQRELLVSELARTQANLRNRIHDFEAYDERWRDVEICLQIDGYRLEGRQFARIEPNIDGAVAVEDDLATELKRSGLPEHGDVTGALTSSAEDFRKVPPDFNGALTHARIGLQTLATAMSRVRQASRPGGFDESKWGQVITHLRTAGLITEEEEKGLAGVFTFVSPGAHMPVGLSEIEMARLGRSLVVGMCYFLVKRYNG